MRFENICLICFFKFLCDYDINLWRYLNPELHPMRDFASLYFLISHNFVCGTWFPRIYKKLNSLYLRKPRRKVAHTKVRYLPRYTCRDLKSHNYIFTMIQYQVLTCQPVACCPTAADPLTRIGCFSTSHFFLIRSGT
jgi:hypothetical protein